MITFLIDLFVCNLLVRGYKVLRHFIFNSEEKVCLKSGMPISQILGYFLYSNVLCICGVSSSMTIV